MVKNPDYTQYQKAPTFAVRCESSKHHTYRKGAPFDIACNGLITANVDVPHTQETDGTHFQNRVRNEGG